VGLPLSTGSLSQMAFALWVLTQVWRT
jgi:hypothetical protein